MTATNIRARVESSTTEAMVSRIAGHLARYGLVIVIGWIGLLKFTSYEAQGIQPLVAHSPFMSWLYDIFSVTTFSSLELRVTDRPSSFQLVAERFLGAAVSDVMQVDL